MDVISQDIPRELRDVPQWGCWWQESRDDAERALKRPPEKTHPARASTRRHGAQYRQDAEEGRNG